MELVQARLIPRLQEIESQALLTTRDGARLDVEGWPEIVARILEGIRGEFSGAEAELEAAAQISAGEVSAKNKTEIMRQLAAVLGVDIFLAEPRLAEILAASTAENVGLIKSIPARFFDEVEQTVLRQFRSGQRASDIAPEIAQRFAVSRKRAAFISRDQVSKLNGDLTRMRQVELGIPGYIWRTSQDERVRPDHAKLDGTEQSWDKPPIVDERTGRRAHPGGDFQCRCTAEPDVEGLLDQLLAEGGEGTGIGVSRFELRGFDR